MHLIRDLFASDVTRDIPPVVYFHEQQPEKLQMEVAEYIITGGWNPSHPNHKRVSDGIHESYVRLLTHIAAELEKPRGLELLPAAWISGFYGSGKSSFAKLLGLALDNRLLPDGTPLVEALLRRDTSQRAPELRAAWERLRSRVEPIAVVFDIGGVARDGEQIHAAIVRQVQRRLGYCPEPHVADFELKIEHAGDGQRFAELAAEVLGRPWAEVKDDPMAEEDFSLVMSHLYPDRYTDPMAWFASRAGTDAGQGASAGEAAVQMRDMLTFRAPDATLFVVVDEVSQYIHQDNGRMLALQSFVSELQSRLKGRAWLLVTGQEKLDEAGDRVVLGKMKDRFPPRFRVHLGQTNIRDVVHKRLLQKTPAADRALRALFEKHGPELRLYGYETQHLTEDDFVEVYPMFPGHLDLILQITSALRVRSSRTQGDDQAIRGLMQLLGELFRARRLAEREIGALVTLDEVYEVQHTALDSEVQASMARVLSRCTADGESPLLVRAAKAVALLEVLSESQAVTSALVASCLFDHVARGNGEPAVKEALEELRRRNLLSYSVKQGYRVQSSAAEEWERERREITLPREKLSRAVRELLVKLVQKPNHPKLQGRAFPYAAFYSDGRAAVDERLVDPRTRATFTVDFRFATKADHTGEGARAAWIKRSDETHLRDRLLWVCGDLDQVEHFARERERSLGMVAKYAPRRASLPPARRDLLTQESDQAERLEKDLLEAIEAAWLGGTMYFRGRAIDPRDHGQAFATALEAAGVRHLPDLYPHFTALQVDPSELAQLLQIELSGVGAKFTEHALALFEIEGNRYVATCQGVVPSRILDHIAAERGVSGSLLLKTFEGPPYGYPVNVVQACLAGLLRGSKIRIEPEGGPPITAPRDIGVQDVFTKLNAFRKATFLPDEQPRDPRMLARICRFFEDHLDRRLDREEQAIADAVQQVFPELAARQRNVLRRLDQVLDNIVAAPTKLRDLHEVLEACLRRVRETAPTVRAVGKHLDALIDGVNALKIYDAELTEDALVAVKRAQEVSRVVAAQLRDEPTLDAPVQAAIEALAELLEGDRPWQALAELEAPRDAVLAAYDERRQHLLEWQEQQAEAARAGVRQRDGFETLSGDESHHVLRPITEALTDTTPTIWQPPLSALRHDFARKLAEAERTANERLDDILEKRDRRRVHRVPLRPLRNRELNGPEDLEALLAELREQLRPLLEKGGRVRLL